MWQECSLLYHQIKVLNFNSIGPTWANNCDQSTYYIVIDFSLGYCLPFNP